MNRKAIKLIELLNSSPHGLVVEIGAIRESQENPTEGFSTVYLARECKKLGRTFRSIELEEKNFRMANAVLSSFMLPPCVEHGDGGKLVSSYGPISFLYLDSSRFPGHTMDQYKAAELVDGAVVAVDDAHTFDDHEFGKAQFLVEYLKNANIPFSLSYTSAEWETVYRMMHFKQTKYKKSGELL